LAKNPKKSLYEELGEKFKLKDSNEIIYEFKTFLDSYIELPDSKLIYSFYYLQNQFFWKSILTTAKFEKFNDFEELCVELRRLFYLYWIAGYTSTKLKQLTFNIILWIKEKKSLDFIKIEIEKKIKKDDVLTRAIKSITNDAYGESWLRPLLALIEYNQTDNSKISFIELDNRIHVDHILPEKWSSVKEWKEIWDEQKAKKWLMKLGNLTLLSGKKNIAQQNDPPLKKKEMYEKGYGGKTAFEISKPIIQIFEKEGWNEKHVEYRQKWMLEEVDKLFSLNSEINIDETSEGGISEDAVLNKDIKSHNIPEKNYNLDYHLSKVKDASVKQRINQLREMIRSLDPNIEEFYSKYQIRFRRDHNFCLIYCQPTNFWVSINLHKNEVNNPELDVRPHKDTDWVHIRMNEQTNLEVLIPFIKKALEMN
jgi:predicted transport protein